MSASSTHALARDMLPKLDVAGSSPVARSPTKHIGVHRRPADLGRPIRYAFSSDIHWLGELDATLVPYDASGPKSGRSASAILPSASVIGTDLKCSSNDESTRMSGVALVRRG
jgi:hypothetical protein